MKFISMNNELNQLRNAVNLIDEEPDFYAELQDAAREVLQENPGIDMDAWIDILMRQYPTEIVDAFGTNPTKIYDSLSVVWEQI